MIRNKHRRLARHSGDLNVAFHVKVASIKNMEARREFLLDYIHRDLGWKILYVSKDVSNAFWLRNTTYHRTLVLGSGWSKKDARHQCITLLHEIVHMRQRLRLGQAKFLAYYAVAEWRWALDVSAYRSNRLFSSATVDPEWIYKFYRLGRLSKRDVIEETNEILMAVNNL